MIKNDLPYDMRLMCTEQRTTHEKIAEQITPPVTASGLRAALYRDTAGHLSPLIVKALEILGYDIELKYVKRKEGKK
jgi:hypothetical protein